MKTTLYSATLKMASNHMVKCMSKFYKQKNLEIIFGPNPIFSSIENIFTAGPMLGMMQWAIIAAAGSPPF